ncbi:MAG: ABC transporter permease [Actinomycetota bacterium]
MTVEGDVGTAQLGAGADPADTIEAPGDAGLAPTAEPTARSQWALFRRRFLRHRMALPAFLFLFLLSFACYGASWVAPYDRNDQELARADMQPSMDHLMGTDGLGRDLLSEIFFAGRVTLTIGFAVAILSTSLGAVVGAFAGYRGGWIDNLLSRVTDLFLVVPALLVAMVSLSYVRQEARFLWWDVGEKMLFIEVNAPFAIIVTLSFLSWTYVARLVRGQVLSIKEKEFVEAARAAGASTPRIIFRHVLPNSIGVIMVNVTLVVAYAIILEATLSYLGFGLVPPEFSWGSLIYDARSTVGSDKAYTLYFPGLMLFLTVLCVNFLGDGLRDAFDPRGKQDHI